MVYLAAEIRAKIEAGLIMWGVDEDGWIEWVGTRDKWRLAERLEDAYLQEDEDFVMRLLPGGREMDLLLSLVK